MAKRGRFAGGSGYAGIPQQVINQIRLQAAGQNTSNTSETVKPNQAQTGGSETQVKAKGGKISEGYRELLVEKAVAEYKTLTPEQRAAKYADDPVLSGRFTNINDTLAGLYKYQSVQNLLPQADDPNYKKKMKAYNQAAASLTTADQEASKAFFQLGGTFSGGHLGGNRYSVNYGLGTNVLDGLNSAISGSPSTTPGINLNYKYAPDSASGLGFALPGMNQKTGQMNLSQNQLGKLKELRGIKQAGGTLSANQQAKLARLKALKNSDMP